MSSVDHDAICGLIHTDAWFLDDGDLAGVVGLLARAVVVGGD